VGSDRRMSDTSAELEQRFRAMLLARSGEDRLKMGCSVHAMAQKLVRASVLAKFPFASPAAVRRELFLRFYGGEFDPEVRDRILQALDAESPSAHAIPPRQHHS